MNKKVVILLAIFLTIIGLIWFLFFNKKQTPLVNSIANQIGVAKQTNPSETMIEYADPSGFTFSYPDNLSLNKSDVEDNSTYADLILSSKDVSGSLSLKIVDSKFKTLDEWAKINKEAAKEGPKEVKLGTLKASEIKTADRLLLGALDQGILFTIEMPLIEEVFWMKVYNKILTDFSFASPQAAIGTDANTSVSTNDVIFEGEEVVE